MVENTFDVPFEAVCEMHRTIDGLVSLTPSVLHPRVEPIGTDDRTVKSGLEHWLVIEPAGLGIEWRWRARIVDRWDGPDEMGFEDVQLDGPFDTWRHRHRIIATPSGTTLIDDVRYRGPPGGPIGAMLVPSMLELMFDYRAGVIADTVEE